MWASSQGRVETVIALLQAGASVNVKDSDGVNALMWAAGSEAAEEAHKKGKSLSVQMLHPLYNPSS